MVSSCASGAKLTLLPSDLREFFRFLVVGPSILCCNSTTTDQAAAVGQLLKSNKDLAADLLAYGQCMLSRIFANSVGGDRGVVRSRLISIQI